MKIAVASGKGGTGKTTVAINLAFSIGQCTLLDCDVEEPDANLYLKADLEQLEEATMPNPIIDAELCDLCGKCVRFCRYNALAKLPSEILLFPHICNGCGGCALVCPKAAITEAPRTMGVIEKGRRGAITFYGGTLSIGEARSPPVIRQLKGHIPPEGNTILDSPPGSSCPFVTTVSGCDYVVLVTEPTPFGLHDLRMVIEVLNELGISYGVIINRHDIGDSAVEEFLAQNSIELLGKIPNSMDIARLGSNGKILVENDMEMRHMFQGLLEKIRAKVGE